MQLRPDFAYQPTTPIKPQGVSYPPTPTPTPTPTPAPAPPPVTPDLGPLQGLLGSWSGTGFNVIWRPDSPPDPDHFLELNVTADQITFDAIPGSIPNRGLLQGD
jgi:hypothetical protein